MYFVYDISSYLSWFFTQSLRIAGYGFDLLDSIQFNGFSLLEFILTLGVLAVLLSIVLPTYYNGQSHNIAYNKWAKEHGKD